MMKRCIFILIVIQLVTSCSNSQREPTTTPLPPTKIKPVPTKTKPPPTSTMVPSPTSSPTITGTPSPTPLPDFDGTPMALYVGRMFPVSFHYPAGWEKTEESSEEGKVRVIFEDPTGQILWISERDLNIYTDFPGSMTLEEFVEINYNAQSTGANFTEIRRETLINSQGYPYHIFVYSEGLIPEFTRVTHRLIYMYEDYGNIIIDYIVLRDKALDYEELVEYSFSTFSVIE